MVFASLDPHTIETNMVFASLELQISLKTTVFVTEDTSFTCIQIVPESISLILHGHSWMYTLRNCVLPCTFLAHNSKLILTKNLNLMIKCSFFIYFYLICKYCNLLPFECIIYNTVAGLNMKFAIFIQLVYFLWCNVEINKLQQNRKACIVLFDDGFWSTRFTILLRSKF